MTLLFADTFYYLALINPRDLAHKRATSFTSTFDGKLITTAWVITELADALADPVQRPAFRAVITKMRSDPRITIVPPSEALQNAGIELYLKRSDKGWSLTDCISFVVMERHGLTQALTADHHFEQAGFEIVLK